MIWPDYPTWAHVAFWILAAVSLAVLVQAWRTRRVKTAAMRFPARHRLDGVKRGWKARFVNAPLALRTVAIPLALVALSRPQLPEEETAEVEGIDIVVALDLSGSMASVDISDEDLVALQNQGKDPPDRFTIAVDVLREFIKSRKYDRVGLVVFGKEAFLQFPLTLDYGVMIRMLDAMRLGDIDGGATVIGNALAMSVARLRDSEAKTRLVILITDGEDNGSNISPVEMAQEAGKRGITVFPILVGTEDQSRQPTDIIDAFTGQRIYKKVDNPVNPALLKQIADETGGRFYRSTDKKGLSEDLRDILDQFEKSRLVDYAAAERTELFPWFLLPALALLFLEILLSQTVLRRFP
ncbi:MAG: VWA domain-containing protein [Myxococcales bacterium]|nr:VWA domain-containing protein [Myxococcales bacterium]MCB9524845.1 VWA domain-containing protein [Myxococcales bacterium]